MIAFKWTGFSHVSMSTLVCQTVCLLLTTFHFPMHKNCKK